MSRIGRFLSNEKAVARLVGSFLVFALFYFILARLAWVRYPYEQQVIYPLSLFIHQTAVVLTCLSIIAFVVLLVSIPVAIYNFSFNRWHIFRAVLMLFPIGFFCVPAIGTFFVNLQHQDSIQLNNHIYHLALVTDQDLDATSNYFVVYQCNEQGVVCDPIYRSEFYYEYFGQTFAGLPSRVDLILDSANNAIYLELDAERIHIPAD